VAGWAGTGFGKADPATGGGAAALGFFGFGRIDLRSFGGGTAGLSSANTGLSSMMVVACEAKSSGLRITPMADHRSGKNRAATNPGKFVKEWLAPNISALNTHYKSDGYERDKTLLRLSTAAGSSRIWPIRRSGFSSAIGTSV
jgi:hypothetical protein